MPVNLPFEGLFFAITLAEVLKDAKAICAKLSLFFLKANNSNTKWFFANGAWPEKNYHKFIKKNEIVGATESNRLKC